VTEFLGAIWGMMPSTFMIMAPILIAAAGGMICERSGVVNIALEGLMVIGAMAAATTHVLLVRSSFGFSMPAALVAAALMGGAFSLIHAFASVTLRADQVISGAGINLFSLGITVFASQLLFGADRTPSHGVAMTRGFLGLFPTIWIALAVAALSWFALYRRPWGLRVRAAGEHPHALAAAGVSVARIRYAAVAASGLLAGLAGGCIVLTQDSQFSTTTINGTGFIALAAVSFGRWLPLGIVGSSFVFGMSTALAVSFINIRALRERFPADLIDPTAFFNAMPFVITLATLIIFSGKDYAPRAVGKPFDKGKG